MAGRSDLRTIDVVIAGAGPAGAAAAIACASAGLRVTLLDRRAFPRERPGETLHPGVEAPLRELGVLERVEQIGFERHPGVEVTWDGATRFEAYGADANGPWLGYQADRARFDAALVERARELGVVVRERCRAIAPTLADGRVNGAQTSDGWLRADYVVDAAGGGHWLARHLELAIDRRSPPLVARYGYATGEWPQRDAAPAIVADADGWTWSARVQERRYAWTRLDPNSPTGVSSPLPAAMSGLAPAGRTRGADVSWRAVRAPAGPGYVAVGDAALVLDPASSHGVLRAILTGMYAARLVAAACSQPHAAAQLGDAYCDVVGEWFERDVTALSALYARLPAPPRWVRDAASVAGGA